MKMVIYQCQDDECRSYFAVDVVGAEISLGSPSCPVCGEDNTVELGETDVTWEAKAK